MGEHLFTSFDIDPPDLYHQYRVRPAGRYISRTVVPANLLNGGRYAVGFNASVYRVKRYFEEEQALYFHVDPTGAPGAHWPEKRRGLLRPALDWEIEKLAEKR